MFGEVQAGRRRVIEQVPCLLTTPNASNIVQATLGTKAGRAIQDYFSMSVHYGSNGYSYWTLNATVVTYYGAHDFPQLAFYALDGGFSSAQCKLLGYDVFVP